MAEIQDCLTGDGWEALRDRISGGADLEEWARRSGELYFKRLKSLAHLDQLPAKDPDLARTWLYANLIATLIVEVLASEFLGSPPSAPSGQTEERLPLAPLG